MNHLGVKLDAVESSQNNPHGSHNAGACIGKYGITFGRGRYMVAVAHPYIKAAVESVKESAWFDHFYGGRTVFTGYPPFEFSAQDNREKLQPIADPQHRDTEVEDFGIYLRVILVEYRGWTA